MIYLIIYAALARRFQGLSQEEMPLKRSWRMLVWVPLAIAFWELGGWWALALGSIPGLWSWLPGKYNSFLVWRLAGKRIHTAYAEMAQGALGALPAAIFVGVG